MDATGESCSGGRLAAVLRAGTRGLYVDGAVVQLAPAYGQWICGEDFTGPFVPEQSGPELIGGQLAAGIDWRAPSGALTLVPVGRAGRAGG